jgi:hypothetical protein
MTRGPVVADENTSLDELVHLMENNGIKRCRCCGTTSWSASSLVRICFKPWPAWPRRFRTPLRMMNTSATHPAATDWRPTGLQVAVCNGVVHLHGLIINDDSARRASIVAAENTKVTLCHAQGSEYGLATPPNLGRCRGDHLAVRRARRLEFWHHANLADDDVDHRGYCHRRRMESATRVLNAPASSLK